MSAATDYCHALTDADLVVTAAARARIGGLVADTGGEAEAVRIYVSGGGCGGMNYGMTFAEKPEATDSVMVGGGVGNGDGAGDGKVSGGGNGKTGVGDGKVSGGDGNGGGDAGGAHFKLVVDPVALGFLRGAEVDYQDDGVNATFVFNNVFQAVGGSGACGGCGGGAF